MKQSVILFSALSLLFLSLACATQDKPGENEAIVNISFKNMDVDSLTVGIFDLAKAVVPEPQKVAIENGRFLLQFEEDGLYKVFLSMPDSENWHSSNFHFYASPGDVINIVAEGKEDYFNYVVKGSEVNRQFMEYKGVAGQLIIDQLRAFNDYREAPNDSIRSVILNDYMSINSQLRKARLEFVKSHPDYLLSAILLGRDEKQDILEIYPLLSENVKRSPLGRRLGDRVEIWNAVALGKKAPSFEYTTIDSVTFNMDTARSKYLVLNFWGTWCGPCMEGLPKMVEYYNKNSDKVEFVSIACRDTEEEVRKVVEEQDVRWAQIINSTEIDLSKQYGIEGYPTKIIVNPQGVIEGIYLGSTPAIFNDLDVLLGAI